MATDQLTPHDTEVDAMVAVIAQHEELTNDDLEHARKMAKALLKAAYQQFLKRDWLTIGVRAGAGFVPIGIFATEGQAAAWASKNLGTSEVSITTEQTITTTGKPRNKKVVELTAPISVILGADRLADYEPTMVDETRFDDPACVRCGHLEVHHGARRVKYGSGGQDWVVDNRGAGTCLVNCKCPKFQRPGE